MAVVTGTHDVRIDFVHPACAVRIVKIAAADDCGNRVVFRIEIAFALKAAHGFELFTVFFFILLFNYR
jgi:hypothetical protein